MAEAIAIVSFISAITGLVDVGQKLVRRLNEFHSNTRDIPTSFKHTRAQLPIVIDGLRRIEEHAESGYVDRSTQKALVPTIEGCSERVASLLELLEEVLPKKDDSSFDRAIKAARSLRKDKQVHVLLKDIDRYLTSLTFHNTSVGVTPPVQTLTTRHVDMIPSGRDPNFVDRPDLFVAIASVMTQHKRAALAGIGGIGKTQIAIEYCYRYSSSHVLWMHSSSTSTFVQSCRIVAERLELPGCRDPQVDTIRLLDVWLDETWNRNWLLVIDNLDDLATLEERLPSETGPKTVLQFFARKTNGSVLITTRDRRVGERLTVRGTTITVPTLSPVEGRLLLHKYTDSISDYGLGEVDGLMLALDYLPLAITQAAAYMSENYITLREYASLLKEGQDEMQTLLSESLSDGRRGDPDSNSVIRTWKLSFEQIKRQDPRTADLLSLMAMFDRQGVPLEFLKREKASNHVLASSLATLRNFSLVDRTPDGGAYSMHRLVQVAVQAWVKIEGTFAGYQQAALSILADVFPSGDYETWSLCDAYLPHAKIILQNRDDSVESRTKRAELLQRISWFNRRQERYEVAKREAEEAAQLFKSIGGPKDPRSLSCSVTVADCLIELWQPREADQILQTTTSVMKNVYGPRHPETFRSMGNRAWAIHRTGDYEEASNLLRETMECREAELGPIDSATLLSINNFAVNLDSLGSERRERGKELHQTVLSRREAKLGISHPDTLESFLNLASCLDELGENQEAEALFRRLLVLRQAEFGSENPSTLTVMHQLAVCLSNQGRFDESLAIDKATLASRLTLCGQDHIDTVMSRANIIRNLWSLDHLTEAAEQCQIILASKEGIARSPHPYAMEAVEMAEGFLNRVEERNSQR